MVATGKGRLTRPGNYLAVVRGAIFLAVVLAALASSVAAVDAATELCGAHLRPMVAVPPTDAKSSQIYGFVLQALSERSAEGWIVADTDHGWFDWNFPKTPLVSHPDKMVVHGLEAQGRDYESAPLYVAFPPGTVVRHAWIERSQTHDEHMFDYDQQGMVVCRVPDLADPDVHAPVTLPSPSADLATRAIVAQSTEARFDPKCDKPFQGASVTEIPRPEVRADFTGENYAATFAIAAIGADNKLLDLWIVGTSGNQRWDLAVQRALHFATYHAPVSYCESVDTMLYIEYDRGYIGL